MAVQPRVSGRLGNVIDLNITFYRNGVATDPYAVRKVSIYRSAVQAENLVAEFPVISPLNTTYPNPLSRELDSSGVASPGVFHLYWDVPATGIPVPDIFFDVWHFLADDPGALPGVTETGGTVGDVTGGSILDDETLWQSCCERFWLYDDGFFCDSGLETIRLGFEAIDMKYQQPEVRTLEVGMMPLPLYDYNYNLIAPIIPQLTATISFMTDNCENLILNESMRIGLRQGTFRSNPFVLQYTLDSSRFLKGSYKYQITVTLPNGETRVSPPFSIQVS